MFLKRRSARRLSSQLSEVRLFLLHVCKKNVDVSGVKDVRMCFPPINNVITACEFFHGII